MAGRGGTCGGAAAAAATGSRIQDERAVAIGAREPATTVVHAIAERAVLGVREDAHGPRRTAELAPAIGTVAPGKWLLRALPLACLEGASALRTKRTGPEAEWGALFAAAANGGLRPRYLAPHDLDFLDNGINRSSSAQRDTGAARRGRARRRLPLLAVMHLDQEAS